VCGRSEQTLLRIFVWERERERSGERISSPAVRDSYEEKEKSIEKERERESAREREVDSVR